MDTPQSRWSAMTFDLVPMDDSPSPATCRPATPVERAPDPDAIREAYLQARFPGVIRVLSDLGDADRVIDAARCYAYDGRADRAQELVTLALAEHPGLGAQLQVQPASAGPGRPACHQAARIHRILVARAAAGTRTP